MRNAKLRSKRLIRRSIPITGKNEPGSWNGFENKRHRSYKHVWTFYVCHVPKKQNTT